MIGTGVHLYYMYINVCKLRDLLAIWRGRKACRKRESLSLVGVLAHAGKVVRAGRFFTSRLIASTGSTTRRTAGCAQTGHPKIGLISGATLEMAKPTPHKNHMHQ